MTHSRQQSQTFRSLVSFRTNGDAPPLFFLHGVTGTTDEFKPIFPHLPAEHPLYGVQAQALDPAGRTLTSLEEMATYYLADIRAVQPAGPHYFIGFSFGGMLAFEMAQQLIAQGEVPPILIMIDSTEMTYLRRQSRAATPDQRASDFYQRLRRRFGEAFARPDTLAYIQDKIYSRMLRWLYRIASRSGLPLPASLHQPFHINWFAAVNYHPRPYAGKIILFKATEHFWEPGMPEDLGWGPLAQQGVEMQTIDGDHVSLFVEPTVRRLGERITSVLGDSARH